MRLFSYRPWVAGMAACLLWMPVAGVAAPGDPCDGSRYVWKADGGFGFNLRVESLSTDALDVDYSMLTRIKPQYSDAAAGACNTDPVHTGSVCNLTIFGGAFPFTMTQVCSPTDAALPTSSQSLTIIWIGLATICYALGFMGGQQR